MALLFQVLYIIRSLRPRCRERKLMEQWDYKTLFRWFVGLNMDDPIWDPTAFTKNRQRLSDGARLTWCYGRREPRPPEEALDDKPARTPIGSTCDQRPSCQSDYSLSQILR